MDGYKRYFSGIFPNEIRESPYQLLFFTYDQFIDDCDSEWGKSELKKVYHPKDHYPDLNCDTQFIDLVYKLDPPSKITEFLDYQLGKYMGTKIDFVDHISILMENNRFHYEKIDKGNLIIEPEIVTIKVRKDQDDYLMKLRDPLKVLKRNKVYEWIDEKRKELKEEVKEPQTPQVKTKFSQNKQMLLLERLGVLEKLNKAGLTKTDQAKIISLLINKNEQNTREFLTYGFGNAEPRDQAKKKYYCRTPENLDFINNLLKGMNIP